MKWNNIWTLWHPTWTSNSAKNNYNLLVSGVPRTVKLVDAGPVFRDLAFAAFGVTIPRIDCTQVHPDGDHRLIMRFGNLVEHNSAFSALLNASKNNWRRTPRNLLDVTITQRKSNGDKTIYEMCKHLKSRKLISHFDTDNISGKMKVKFPSGYRKTIQSKDDLLALAKGHPEIEIKLRSHLQCLLIIFIEHFSYVI